MSGLIIQNGPQAGQQYNLSPGAYLIGRATDSHIHIDERTVSKQHAQLTVQGQQLILDDLGSSNGTFVNGQRIRQPTVLHSGDLVQVGTAITLAVQGTQVQSLPVAASPGAAPPVAPPIRRQPNYGLIGFIVVILLGAAGGGWYWWQTNANQQAAAPPEPTATATSTATETPPPAMAMIFSAAKESVDLGECVSLSWQVENAQEVRLSGEVVPAESSRQVCPRESNEIYRLTAQSLAGETEEQTVSLTVRPTPPPPPGVSIDFEANETRVLHGECTTLEWEVSNALAVRLDDDKVSASGQQQICPTEPATTYTLLVQPLDGELVEQVIIVNVPPTATPKPSATPVPTATPKPTAKPRASAPVIDQLMADQYQLNSGGCTTLRWRTRNAQTVRLDGDQVANSGSKQVCPPASTNTYTLVATGNGSVQDSVTLNVSAPPTAPPVAQPNPVAPVDPVAPVQPAAPAGPPSVNVCASYEGNYCYRFRWDIENVSEIYFDGQGVGGHDSAEVCSDGSDQPGDAGNLRIVHTDGREETISSWPACN